MNKIKTVALAWALVATSAWGAQIADFTPQGQVAQVESIKLRFSEPVIAFGNSQAPDPVLVECNDSGLLGHGRWLDGSNWTYEFAQSPAPGVRCEVSVQSTFRSLDDAPLTGKARFSFSTGGPSISTVRPRYADIAEDQMFVLKFNAPVEASSVVSGSQCLVQGLGEVVPVRLITGDIRTQILDSLHYPAFSDTPDTHVLQCTRLLPPEAKVQLRVGPGISTLSDQRPAVASSAPEAFDYTVQAPFTASFTCRRENASSPCTPVSDMAISFSAPVSRADAKEIRLQIGSENVFPAMEQSGDDGDVRYVPFKAPFPASTDFTIHLPENLRDDAGRALVNAEQFPQASKTAAFPPLVKFSASPFGIIERFAQAPVGGHDNDDPPSLPLTLRNVESSLATQQILISAGQVVDYATQDDQEVLRWYARVRRMDEASYTAAEIKSIMSDQETVYVPGEHTRIDTRGVTLLKNHEGTRRLVLPGVQKDAERPFEVIGVPLQDPGFHVLEVESARLGQSLLASSNPMYVRTTALVTNLGVHLKTGRDDTLAWVTTLDDGQVVANAQINVLDCSGEVLAQGVTDQQGLWHHLQPLPSDGYCSNNGLSGVYVSARIPADHPQARGKADFSFVFSDWNDGIESWRFNVSTDTRAEPTRVAHTVFDRTLLRAGETVSMKHFVREQNRAGMVVPITNLPTRLVIEHQGSGDRKEFPVPWAKTASGGLSAQNQYVLPKTAKLGVYTSMLTDDQNAWYGSQEFRVEAFKLPLLTGSLKISEPTAGPALIAPKALNADVQLIYVSGGPAGQLQVSLSGVLRDKSVGFPEYDDYSFQSPEDLSDTQYDEDGYPVHDSAQQQTLFLDKQLLTLDAQGGGRVVANTLPDIKNAHDLLFEASFADPNGEVQTLAQTVPVWPSAVVAGIRSGSWLAGGQDANISAVALSPTGVPQPDTPMTITAMVHTTYSTRQRMVGGFYSYQNRTETRNLGAICQGKTNAQGLLDCSVNLKESGRIQLLASATDSEGRVSSAATSVWVLGQGELWFGGNNDDRIDIIPSRKTWKPGEMAEFQVRMPFRRATALVAIEREGVLETHVLDLKGDDPTVRLPVKAEWGPNVYVSVLALRGRLRDVPWQSFFTWGWKQPTVWYGAFSNASKFVAPPTALIDLSKPAFRFGLAEIQVSDEQDQLLVKVSTDKPRYQVRENATVTIKVTTPDGKPAAHGSVAFAAVDQALLELSPNSSWDILAALRQSRSYGVETATAQMQVVGRRHYGRKALPAGGGGGKSPTRELLDTLLLWEPDITLDQDGQAQVTLPLNDAISRFTLVAISDYGPERFGHGTTDIVSTQDVQVIAGLPPQVREGDHYQAMVTVRNSAERDLSLLVSATHSGLGTDNATLPAQTVRLASGEAQTVQWEVTAPESDLMDHAVVLDWVLEAHEQVVSGQTGSASKPAGDRLAFQQTLVPVYPVRTQQSTLLALNAAKPALSVPVAAPEAALRNALGVPRGGLQVHLQSSLAGGLTGVREWFRHYPYTCLEQLGSKAIGLRSQNQWDSLMESLPAYLDDDGLAAYFPGARYGNEVLTAYLLSASHEAQALGLPFVIPEPARQKMLDGLLNYVQGKLTRTHWAPVKDTDTRKLLVLEALSRYQRVTPNMLDSIQITPDRWPTSAVIDWMAVLHRVPAIPGQVSSLSQARQIILGRMLSRGTELVFADNSQNNAWWLMVSPETNLAKLMLVTLGEPAWEAEHARMAQGLLQLQRQGAWRTTTSNLLGSLAIQKFAQHHESEPVSGSVQLQLYPGEDVETLDWVQSQNADGVRVLEYTLPWTQQADGILLMQPQGQGQPWATVSSLAAIASTQAVVAGYQLQRTVTPVSQAQAGVWSRGDVYRVSIAILAKGGMTWAALTDPIPSGATILGSGLGRDSGIATNAESGSWYQPSFIERGFDSWRGYYEYLPAGKTTVEYTVRLNTPGRFQLPPTRIETLYNPEVRGELPNLDYFVVQP